MALFPNLRICKSSHDWLGRFASTLMLKLPNMHPGAAVQFATMVYEDQAHLDPQRAAMKFMREYRKELERFKEPECA